MVSGHIPGISRQISRISGILRRISRFSSRISGNFGRISRITGIAGILGWISGILGQIKDICSPDLAVFGPSGYYTIKGFMAGLVTSAYNTGIHFSKKLNLIIIVLYKLFTC